MGISYEADQKHAEAIIRETGASNLTSLKIAMSKESKDGVRDRTDNIVEKRGLGKLGMNEQPLIGQMLSPGNNCQFSCHRHWRHRVLRKRIDTSHGNTDNSRVGEDGEIGEVFEKQTTIVVQVSRDAVQQKNTPEYHGRIHSCRMSSHQNVVRNTSCCGSQFSGSRIVCLSESIGRNNGTHIDVQRPRPETMGPMSGLVLGDVSAALAIVARRGLGKLRHLDTNYLWIQEKAAKGDLDFKRVAGVDNGADLFTKTLSWNEIQSHNHKLRSQFVQNEISVNYVGARPNGVNLPRVLPVAESWQRVEQT